MITLSLGLRVSPHLDEPKQLASSTRLWVPACVGLVHAWLHVLM